MACWEEKVRVYINILYLYPQHAFFWEVSFNYSTLHTWNRFWRHLHGSEDERRSGWEDAWEGMGEPAVAVGKKGAVGPCKTFLAL